MAVVPRPPERVNLEVFVRVRPHLGNEQDPMAVTCVNDDGIQLVSDNVVRRFDKVFREDSVQEDIYSTVGRRGISQVLSGYYSTVFLYGQTGSGKTYTANGHQGSKGLSEDSGLVPRCVHGVFEQIACDSEHDYRVEVEWIQIYQENVLDLLTSNNTTSLQIRECPDNGVFLVGATKVLINSPHEFIDLLRTADKNRITALTKMNATSSRSHSCLMVTVHKRKTLTIEDHMHSDSRVPGRNNNIIKGRLSLVDLAGSERLKKSQSEGQRKSEARYINSSLACLGNVLQAIVDKQKHIPYRDSKLTRLLQDSLGGTGIASFIVTVSPLAVHTAETYQSILFAERAKEVRNAPIIHRDFDINEKWLVLQASLEDQIALLEAKNRRLEADKARILHDPDEATAASSTLNKKIRDLYSMLRDKEYHLELSNQRASEAEATVVTQKEKIKTLAKTLSSHQDTVIALEEECASANIRIQAFESELSVSKGQHYTATVANDGLDLLLDELKGRLERQEQEHMTELADLRNSTETERRSTQQLLQEHREKAESESSMLRVTIDTQKVENETLTSELKKLRLEIKEMRDAKRKNDTDESDSINDLKRILSQKQSTIETLTYELEEQQVLLQGSQDALNASKQQVTNLQGELLEVQKATDNALLQASSDLQQCRDSLQSEKAQTRALTEELQHTLIQLKESSQPCGSCGDLSAENERLLESLSEQKRDFDVQTSTQASQIQLLNEQLCQLQDCAKCEALQAETDALKTHIDTLQNETQSLKEKNDDLTTLLNQLSERDCENCLQLQQLLQSERNNNTTSAEQYDSLKELNNQLQSTLAIQSSEQEQHIQLIQQLRESESMLSSKVASLETQAGTSDATQNSLRKQLEHQQTCQSSVAAELEQARQELEQRGNDLRKIAVKFEELESDNSELATTLKSVVRELDIEKENNEEHHRQKELLIQNVKTLEVNNDNLQQQLTLLQHDNATRFSDTIANLQQQNNKLNNEIEALVELNDSYETELTHLRSSNNELERETTQLQSTIERHNNNHKEELAVIEEHSKRLADHKESEISNLQQQLELLSESKNALLEEIQSLKVTATQGNDEHIAQTSLLKAKLSASDRNTQKHLTTISEKENEITSLEEKNRTLGIELDNNQSQLTELNNHNDSLKQNIDLLTGINVNLEDEVTALREQHQRSVAVNSSLEEQINQLQQSHSEIVQTNERLAGENANLRETVTNLGEEMTKLSEHNEAIQSNVKATNEECDKIREQSAATETELLTKDSALAALKTQIAANDDTIESLRDDLQGKQVIIESLSEQVATFSSTTTSLQTQLATYTETVSIMENEKNEDRELVTKLQHSITVMEGDMSTKEADIKSLSEQLQKSSSDVNSLRNQLTTCNESLSVIDIEKCELNRMIATLQNDITEKNSTITTLTEQVTELDADRQQKAAAIEKLELTICNLESTQGQQLQSMNSRFADSREMLLVLQEERKGYINQIDMLKAKLSASENATATLEGQKSTDANRIVELTKTVDSLQQQRDNHDNDLSTTIDALQLKISTLTTQLSHSEKQHISISEDYYLAVEELETLKEDNTQISQQLVILQESSDRNNLHYQLASEYNDIVFGEHERLQTTNYNITENTTCLHQQMLILQEHCDRKDYWVKESSEFDDIIIEESKEVKKSNRLMTATLSQQVAALKDNSDLSKEITADKDSLTKDVAKLQECSERGNIENQWYSEVVAIFVTFSQSKPVSMLHNLFLEQELERSKVTCSYYSSLLSSTVEYVSSLLCAQAVTCHQLHQNKVEAKVATTEIKRLTDLLNVVTERYDKLTEASQKPDVTQQLLEKNSQIEILKSSLEQTSRTLQTSVEDRQRLQECLSQYTKNLKRFAEAEDACSDLADQSTAVTVGALNQEISELKSSLRWNSLSKLETDHQLGAAQIASSFLNTLISSIGLQLSIVVSMNTALEQDIGSLKTNYNDCNTLLQQTMVSLSSKVALSASLQDRLTDSEARLHSQQAEANDRITHLTITVGELQNSLRSERDLYNQKINTFCEDGKTRIARVAEILEERSSTPARSNNSANDSIHEKNNSTASEASSEASQTPVRATGVVATPHSKNQELIVSLSALDTQLQADKDNADADTLRLYVVSLEKQIQDINTDYNTVLVQLTGLKDACSRLAVQRDELIGRLFNNSCNESSMTEVDEFKEADELRHIVNILRSDIAQLEAQSDQIEQALTTVTADRDALRTQIHENQQILSSLTQERDQIFKLFSDSDPHPGESILEFVRALFEENNYFKGVVSRNVTHQSNSSMPAAVDELTQISNTSSVTGSNEDTSLFSSKLQLPDELTTINNSTNTVDDQHQKLKEVLNQMIVTKTDREKLIKIVSEFQESTQCDENMLPPHSYDQLHQLTKELQSVTAERDRLSRLVEDLQEERNTLHPDELNFSEQSAVTIKEELDTIRREKDKLFNEKVNLAIGPDNKQAALLKQLQAIQRDRNKLLRMVREFKPIHEVSPADEFNASSIDQQSNNSDYEPNETIDQHESSGSDFEPNDNNVDDNLLTVVAERDELLRTLETQKKSTQQCLSTLNEERQSLLLKLSAMSTKVTNMRRENESLKSQLQKKDNSLITEKVIAEHEQQAFDTLQSDRAALVYNNNTLQQQVTSLQSDRDCFASVLKELAKETPNYQIPFTPTIASATQLKIDITNLLQKETSDLLILKKVLQIEDESINNIEGLIPTLTEIQRDGKIAQRTILDLEAKLLTTNNIDTIERVDVPTQTDVSTSRSKGQSRKSAELENEIQILKQQHQTRERELKSQLRGKQSEVRRLQSLLPISTSGSDSSVVLPEDHIQATNTLPCCPICESLQTQLQQQLLTINELKSELVSKQKEVDKLQSTCESLEIKTEQQLQQHLVTDADLRSQLKEKQQQVDKLQTTCESLEQKARTQLQQHLATDAGLRSQLKEKQQQIDKLETTCASLEQRVKQQSQCTTCDSLQTQLQQQMTTTNDLLSQLDSKQKQVSKLQTTCESLDQKAKQHQLQLAKVQIGMNDSNAKCRRCDEQKHNDPSLFSKVTPLDQGPEKLVATLTELLETNRNNTTSCSQCLLKDSIIHTLRVKEVANSKAAAIHDIVVSRRDQLECRTPKTVPQSNTSILKKGFKVSAPPELSPFVPIVTSGSGCSQSSNRSPTPPPTLPKEVISSRSSSLTPYPAPDLKSFSKIEMRMLSPHRSH
eukprot:TRINITY_DN2837_c0_g1_i1.p1 TRINITY_DN2837_c0_g1~~TRINITY_DN2837_c0_g1_i1.p1  ORF type:complete len:3230 (+),score=852.98 TRINITY_DN2837_c0_g1_i1:41-9691(+)